MSTERNVKEKMARIGSVKLQTCFSPPQYNIMMQERHCSCFLDFKALKGFVKQCTTV